ncbi:group 3 secretory phospholipase A2-like isoform X2 [Sander lucioperca]|uniref:group 3 secretory phospholipase A2-like isoform X2 n=1 Tax=Sander lucioperca TaxID=283035 RepID=UPI00125CFB31|nr:group 3 secretory phospholipase A2-like isoform X2 [Sander lucioperca]
MQSVCLLQVVSTLSLLILSKAQPVVGSGLSCLRSSPAAAHDGHTRVTFLREDAAGVRALFLSLWSEDARPVKCKVNTDPLVTETYRRLCNRSHEVTRRFNISALLARDARFCAHVSSAAPKLSRRTRREETAGRARRKRAWTFPGTLWCGTGSKALGYEQLGMFEKADGCCREHDHCLHIIPSFTVNYGVFNSHFFTVSHCHCDQRFRQCLLGVNDTISSMVGYSFFNILRVPCFELKQQRRCTEMSWWGTCKVTKKAPYAVFKRPLRYSTSDVTSKHRDNTESNTLTSSEKQRIIINPHRTSPKIEHGCFRDSPRGDPFFLRRTKEKGCKRNRKPYTAAPTTPSTNASLFNTSQSSALMPNNKRVGRKKSTRNRLSAYPKHRSQVQPQTPRNSHPQATSVTQQPAIHLHSKEAVTAATKTGKKGKKSPKQSRCCGVRMPLRGDSFQPRCLSCLTDVTPTPYGFPINQRNQTTAGTLRLDQTTEMAKRDTLERLWSTATSATPATTKPKKAASVPKDDSQLLCGSLKHLDECKYKIHPLEKKFDLQNMESETAYHCDCTSRLAVQIKSFKQPSVLPTLLMDFVSRFCFKLPEEKKCQRGTSCSGGFTPASDLLQALQLMEDKDTAGVRNSVNYRRRGIPARLYKRCLRLERDARVMAQRTRS